MTSTVHGSPIHSALTILNTRRASHAMPPQACRTVSSVPHARHRPEETLLYQIVEQHYPAFLAHVETDGRALPRHVKKEFEAYLKCGRLENGFLRLRCDSCHTDRLVALSCKRRGFCPSYGARRMVDSAALLVDEVLPRQPLCLDRLSLTLSGTIRYTLKNPWRNGTTELLFEPLDFLARLASLVPSFRAHLTRYHGVFAPHSALRAHVTPARRGSRPMASETFSTAVAHQPMSWAQRLKRTFGIDASTCEYCGGAMRLLSTIKDLATAQRILAHLRQPAVVAADRHGPTHRPRGPPQTSVSLS